MLPGIRRYLKQSVSVYLFLVIILSSFLSFWKLGNRPLYEWDKSLYAVVTAEMMSLNDFVNYFFHGRPEYSVSKPPLFFWAVCMCYKIFGFNEWALRFPSAIATVLFFIVLFLWIRQYTNEKFALYSSLVLCSCKAVIGYHVGRTGDTDAFVLLFLMLSLFQFSRYIDFGRKNAVLWCALFLGLGFYSKGTFAFLFIPSMFLYTIWRRKLKSVISDPRLWLSVILLSTIVLTWYLLVTIFAYPGYQSPSGARNSFEQLFLHDTAKRFMKEGLGGKEKTGVDILSLLSDKKIAKG